MSLSSWSLLFLGCDPLAKSVRDEAIWYDTERIVSEAGVELVPISGGDPIGYWPRVVIRREGIDVDNRAWTLTLPEAAFEQAEAAQPLEWSDLVVLQDGRLPEGTDSPLIEPLLEALMEIADSSMADGREYEGVRFDGHLVVVPEPDIPWQTIYAVLYSAANAQFSSWAIVGQAEGRLSVGLRTGGVNFEAAKNN